MSMVPYNEEQCAEFFKEVNGKYIYVSFGDNLQHRGRSRLVIGYDFMLGEGQIYLDEVDAEERRLTFRIDRGFELYHGSKYNLDVELTAQKEVLDVLGEE